jgi:hypothetical protein
MQEDIYPNPIPGILIGEPETIPGIDDVLIGYKLLRAPTGYLVQPSPLKMNTRGWLGVVALAVLFWPISCVPCCLSCSYTDIQIPVYEKPVSL